MILLHEFSLQQKSLNFIQKTNMQNNQKQLNEMLKSEFRNQLSSEQEEDNVSRYQQTNSRNAYRKPIKNPFSQQSDSSDSDLQKTNGQKNISPFPPKQPKPKSVLQQAQQTMKWNRDQQNQVQILTKLQGQGMKDKKIRQLANKYKTLNIAYQKQKTLRKNLQTQLNNQLKINEENRNKSIEKDNKQITVKSNKSLMKDAKCQNPTCVQNQKKIMEFRLQSQNLKTQLNKAHRVIARQIGQNFNIDQVLNEDNAWKGRQQKIQKLKGRVKELQQKLANNGVNVSHMSGFTQMSSATINNNNNNLSMTRTSTMAQNKRKQFDNLKVQVDALKSQNDLLQGKIKSVTSRKLILQNQIKQMKAQYEKKKQILMEKSQNDDKFINLLKAQNQKLKKQERVVTKVVYRDQKDNDEVNNLRKQIQKLRSQLNKAAIQRKSRQKQQKCLDNVDQNISMNEEKIQIKFPPSQKKRNSVQRPPSQKSQTLPESQGENRLARQVSAQKKKQLQNEYLKGNKYLKKLSAEEQISIYQNWKSGKKIQ